MEVSTNLGRVSVVPRGVYDPSVQYEYLDIVQYQGSGYIVLRNVQGVEPSDGNDYMLLVKSGVESAAATPGGNFDASFAINSATGELFMITNDSYTGPQFRLDNGNLEVVYG